MKEREGILVIDFGSQYVQLIARRIREHRVHSLVVPPDIPLKEIKKLSPQGIIFSGGPSSVYDKGSPRIDDGIFDLGIPVLGAIPNSAGAKETPQSVVQPGQVGAPKTA